MESNDNVEYVELSQVTYINVTLPTPEEMASIDNANYDTTWTFDPFTDFTFCQDFQDVIIG